VPALGGRRRHIEPGSPWQNPYVESNARVRDEVLDVELFGSLAEAQLILGGWRADYHAGHPHSALGMLSPERFAARWRDQHAEPAPVQQPTPRFARPAGSLREASAADATVRPDTDQPLSLGVDR